MRGIVVKQNDLNQIEMNESLYFQKILINTQTHRTS
jgi:hypothetical protein